MRIRLQHHCQQLYSAFSHNALDNNGRDAQLYAAGGGGKGGVKRARAHARGRRSTRREKEYKDSPILMTRFHRTREAREKRGIWFVTYIPDVLFAVLVSIFNDDGHVRDWKHTRSSSSNKKRGNSLNERIAKIPPRKPENRIKMFERSLLKPACSLERERCGWK